MTTREFISNFKKSTGRLPSQVELSKSLKISPSTALQSLILYAKEGAKKEKTVIKEKSRKSITVLFLKITLFILFGMTFALSVYFTGLWFIDRFTWIVSGLISVSMVLFMVISPQTLRFINNLFVKTVVIISFMIALSFSMMSTTAGQYNKTSEKIEREPDKAYLFNQLSKSEEEVRQLIQEAQRDKSIHQNTIEMLSASKEDRLSNYQQIATERKYIASFNVRIDELRSELKDTRESQADNGIIEEKRDFYLFISGLTGMEKSFTEFLISALPAVFIDLIAALCLNLALFIGKEKNDERN